MPTSTASGEAPPSTGVSGASSSRSVVRLYSTICQTVGGANRGQAERALCPQPCPRAPGLARPPPVRREDPLSPAGLSGLGPLRPAPPPARSPFSASPSPCRLRLPPRPQRPPPPPRPSAVPGAWGPHSRCRRRPARAARHSWWSRGRRHLRAPGSWPSPRPRPRPPGRSRHRAPSRPLSQPLASPPPPPPPPAEPPPAAAPSREVEGNVGGGARPQLPATGPAPGRHSGARGRPQATPGPLSSSESA